MVILTGPRKTNDFSIANTYPYGVDPKGGSAIFNSEEVSLLYRSMSIFPNSIPRNTRLLVYWINMDGRLEENVTKETSPWVVDQNRLTPRNR